VTQRTQRRHPPHDDDLVAMRLRDGPDVRIRPIRAEDKVMLSRGIGELSDRTVHQRFLSPRRSFTAAELRYLTEVDGHDHVAFVAESPEEPGALIGVGRWVRQREEPDKAEAAIVVADCWQGRGVGSLLATALAAEAHHHGIRRFTARMLSDNQPAQRLMAKLTSHLERTHDGTGASELIGDLAA
jgi:protein lysine acetyltransferase